MASELQKDRMSTKADQLQDFLRDLVIHVVERLMAMDIDNLCAVACRERSGLDLSS
ncbi:MAG: hypothetical protein AB7J34_23360 [Limisphaerales bacterium]